MLFLDAIRFSIEMILIAYNRLSHNLLSISCLNSERDPNWQLPHEIFGAALLDAWSIIDSSIRLSELLKQIPRSKRHAVATDRATETSASPNNVLDLGKMSDVKEFLNCESIKYAHVLRNHFHHLHQDINEQRGIDNPVLGRISWITFVHSAKPTLRAYILVPGAIFSSNHRGINPLGQAIKYPIDLITIEAHDVVLSLSTLAYNTDTLRRNIDAIIQEAISKEPFVTDITKGSITGSDTLLSMDCELEESPENPWPFATKDTR